jgi:hypothetical protein
VQQPDADYHQRDDKAGRDQILALAPVVIVILHGLGYFTRHLLVLGI